ncbi:N-acetylmuramoyl-L-alanine amidase [Peptostreptococcus canis]|uniref:N-acetylmuramoyl-L-alanine amidase n=1 Tax=Peptostreptococcus canis TaxID=1159213 RepID=A0ABR6TMD9_9FIRM|nr:N-acetylmuramoyl-L-alanine amidase [Peptostreptococcus canis]MBC2576592.1 N-acetylmuramoyl-L-alanine amidase [Peptostreptococcus canis]MBP1998779.1 hypothetical protein [Peptostreptococcus canis]
MRIFLSVGHSILRGGGCTSASGYVNEYKYNKELAPYVKRALESLGHTCDVVVCPEGKFTNWKQERGYKLPIANSGRYDIVGELHLNASNGVGHGMECLYYPGDQRGLAIANRACKAFQDLGFKNRGAKARGDLYIISATKPTAVLFESFFCDNKHDTDLAKKLGFDKIAGAICYGLVGQYPNLNKGSETKVNKPVCVMYFRDGNKTTAEFIAQQLNCKCYKDNGKDLPNNEHSKYDIKYIGDLGKTRQDTAKEACKRFLGWNI